VHPGIVASIGSRRPGPSGDVDLQDEHGRAMRERIGGDGRRNCARRAKELRAKKKALARRARKFPAKMKDFRTKIVGSTILGNAKSKMPNTWR